MSEAQKGRVEWPAMSEAQEGRVEWSHGDLNQGRARFRRRQSGSGSSFCQSFCQKDERNHLPRLRPALLRLSHETKYRASSSRGLQNICRGRATVGLGHDQQRRETDATVAIEIAFNEGGSAELG